MPSECAQQAQLDSEWICQTVSLQELCYHAQKLRTHAKNIRSIVYALDWGIGLKCHYTLFYPPPLTIYTETNTNQDIAQDSYDVHSEISLHTRHAIKLLVYCK